MRDNDLFVYGLLFLAIIGFNVFKQFVAARAEQRRRQQQAADALGMPQPDPDPDLEADPFTLTETDWGRPPEAEPLPELRPVHAVAGKPEPARSRSGPAIGAIRPPKPIARGRGRHRLFQHRRALRDGIVMMTVLGPCRALQPYEEDRS